MTYYSADYDGTPGDVELRGGMEILKDLNNLKKHLEGSRCLIGIIEKIAAQQKAAASKGKHPQQICVTNSAEQLVQGYKAAKLVGVNVPPTICKLAWTEKLQEYWNEGRSAEFAALLLDHAAPGSGEVCVAYAAGGDDAVSAELQVTWTCNVGRLTL